MTTISTVFPYPLLAIVSTYLFGLGLAQLLLPKKLQGYALWLAPWVFIIPSICIMTIGSLLGLSISVMAPVIAGIYIFVTIYIYLIKKYKFDINLKRDILIAGFVGISICIGLIPLLLKEKNLTTITLGNNDAIAYAVVPDYLKHHSIIESFKEQEKPLEPAYLGITNLLHVGFRWGTPIIISFYLSIFNLQGYQFAYVSQVVLFAFTVPLLYILLTEMFRKASIYQVVTILLLFVFNGNLLYMLFHNFAGQVLYWGISLILFILYLGLLDKTQKGLTKWYEVSIGITWASLFMSYHEGIIFVVLPLILYVFFEMVRNKRIETRRITSLLYMSFITIILSSISVINAFVFDVIQAGRVAGPIGWEKFRSDFPFANPFEMMGFYSIHSFDPMPVIIALILSLFVISAIIKGIENSHNKLFAFTIFLFFLLFLIWSGIYHKNFFVYYRVVTYLLPVILVLFTGGLFELLNIKRFKFLSYTVVFLLLVSSAYSGIVLVNTFTKNYIPVDRSLISLKQIKEEIELDKPIFLPSLVSNEGYYWGQVWTEYFLYPDMKVISAANFTESENNIPDGSYVLYPKIEWFYKQPKVVEQQVVWENDFYKIIQSCISVECILALEKPISQINFETYEYADILFREGWSNREMGHRLANNKIASVLLYGPQKQYSVLKLTAKTIATPQLMTVYLDDVEIGEVSLSKELKEYSFNLPYNAETGLYRITFKFSHIYTPAEILHNGDTRNVTADFTHISIE